MKSLHRTVAALAVAACLSTTALTGPAAVDPQLSSSGPVATSAAASKAGCVLRVGRATIIPAPAPFNRQFQFFVQSHGSLRCIANHPGVRLTESMAKFFPNHGWVPILKLGTRNVRRNQSVAFDINEPCMPMGTVQYRSNIRAVLRNGTRIGTPFALANLNCG